MLLVHQVVSAATWAIAAALIVLVRVDAVQPALVLSQCLAKQLRQRREKQPVAAIVVMLDASAARMGFVVAKPSQPHSMSWKLVLPQPRLPQNRARSAARMAVANSNDT